MKLATIVSDEAKYLINSDIEDLDGRILHAYGYNVIVSRVELEARCCRGWRHESRHCLQQKNK